MVKGQFWAKDKNSPPGWGSGEKREADTDVWSATPRLEVWEPGFPFQNNASMDAHISRHLPRATVLMPRHKSFSSLFSLTTALGGRHYYGPTKEQLAPQG